MTPTTLAQLTVGRARHAEEQRPRHEALLMRTTLSILTALIALSACGQAGPTAEVFVRSPIKASCVSNANDAQTCVAGSDAEQTCVLYAIDEVGRVTVLRRDLPRPEIGCVIDQDLRLP